MKKLFVIILLVISQQTSAQNVDTTINHIFSTWNEDVRPGGVVAVMKKGEIIHSNAYGKANIKYNVPLTTETLFNIGSVSKQFTAMGIIKLQIEQQLSFDDDIRKYLPELYEFENKITIHHLLHHTSGIRSTPELFGLAGWRDGDLITTDDDLQYLSKQTSLNFEPGTQFMYSNSNCVLLAIIIERVTGEAFNSWMKKNIFEPLRMNQTFVDASNSNQNPKIPTPYNEFQENTFTIGENTSQDIGASNIYTTTHDLMIWMQNFNTPATGWADAFQYLTTVDTLKNGKNNTYAFGIVVDEFLGNKRIQHSGGIPGFLSYLEYYPEEELIVVVLTNFVSHSVDQKVMQLRKVFLKNKSIPEKENKPTPTIPLNKNFAKSIVGDYLNIEDNYPRKISFENDTLWYVRSNGSKSYLNQTRKNEFVMGAINTPVFVQFENDNMIVKDGDNTPQYFEKYDSTPLTNEEKEAYVGTFYSAELETTYTISFDKNSNQLMGYHSRHGAFPIQVIKRDIVNWSGFAIAKYLRNHNENIAGFFINMNRVENVWFEKK